MNFMRQSGKNVFITAFIFTLLLSIFAIKINGYAEGLDKDKIYRIVNPRNYSDMIIDGEGKIIIKSIDPKSENVQLIKDLITKENNFCEKTYIGEKLIKKEYKYDNGTQIEEYPTYRHEYFDKKGNFIEVPNDSNTSCYESIDNYLILSVDYKVDDMMFVRYVLFDTNTKEFITPKYENIGVCNTKPVIYHDLYSGNKNETLEMVIYDSIEDLVLDSKNLPTKKEPLKIEGYTYSGERQYGNKKCGEIARKIDDIVVYNFIDENFNIMLDNDVEEPSYENLNEPVITYKKNNGKYDYNIVTKTESVHKKDEKEARFDERYRKNDELDKKFSDAYDILKKNNGNYNYVDKVSFDGKTLLIANYGDNNDGDYITHADIYNDKYELLKKIENYNTADGDNGRIFDHDGNVYDFDLNIIYNFDKDVSINVIDKFGKTYYVDRYDSKYKDRKRFGMYDTDFNVVFDGLKSLDEWTFDDKLVLSDDEGTKVVNEKFEVEKLISGRNLTLQKNQESKYIHFNDMDRNREGIMNMSFNIIVDNMKTCMDLQKDYFTYLNGFKYGFMDYNGKVLVSFSIFDAFDEDESYKYNPYKTN